MLWKARQIETILSDTKDKNLRMRAIKNTRSTFIEIFHLMDFTADEMNTPLKGSSHKILGLENPYSKASCLLMQLYSMEIGSPQLYAEVNRVARDQDQTFLKELGPFLHALECVTFVAE